MLARKKQFYTDIDGVLLNLEEKMRKYIARGKNLLPHQLPISSCYSLEDGYGITSGDFLLALNKAVKERADLFHGAPEFVRALQSRGFQVVGISTRYDAEAEWAVRRDTESLGLDELIIVRTNGEKIPYFQPGGFYFDDMPMQAAEAAENGCHSYLMSRKYNQHCLDLGGYTRVWGYEHLLRKIETVPQ